ncbi:hypothetical protein D3C76_941780 [compost metagenome]
MIGRQRLLVQPGQVGQWLVDIDENIQAASGKVEQGITPARLEIAHLPVNPWGIEQGFKQYWLQAVQATDAQYRAGLAAGRGHAQAFAQAVQCRAYIVGQAVPGQGRGYADPAFNEQRVAAQVSEATQGVAHRRLRQAHDLRRPGDAALLINRIEGQ